jgi:proline iminopeptidase
LPEGRQRLVVNGCAFARPRFLQLIADLLFGEPAHWVMQTRPFQNLKRRAERPPVRPSERARRG